jgi:hypothetical protein
LPTLQNSRPLQNENSNHGAIFCDALLKEVSRIWHEINRGEMVRAWNLLGKK